MATDVDSLSDEELEELAAQARSALERRKDEKRLDAVREAKALLDAVGLSFREAERLAAGNGAERRKSGSKAKGQTTPKGARFVNPADSSQSWTSGRGRKPTWLRTLEERGEAPAPV